MTVLHAQPYDITAQSFFFRSAQEYDQSVRQARNAAGQPVEEFEIQFIDGDDVDCALDSALGLNQCNFAEFLELTCALYEEDDKLRLIIALGECGYDLTPKTSPDDFDIDPYELDSMRELAEQFVGEGLMGDVPETCCGILTMTPWHAISQLITARLRLPVSATSTAARDVARGSALDRAGGAGWLQGFQTGRVHCA